MGATGFGSGSQPAARHSRKSRDRFPERDGGVGASKVPHVPDGSGSSPGSGHELSEEQHPMFGFDPTFLLVIPALIFALWAQWKVQHTYQKFSKVRAANGRTGREMALAIMQRNGVSDVAVEEVGGMLSDHYDPRTKKVRLSQNNYEGDSIASIAVAAHEVGHVLQHQQGYVPLAIRSAVAPVAQIGSWTAFPLFFLGIFFAGPWSNTLM